MNHRDRNEFIKKEFDKILDISSTKGVEYANSDNDANANFNEIAEKMGLTPQQVLWIYATKHYQAITSYIRTGEVHSEPIEGRIHDLILYCFILLSLEYEHKIPVGEQKAGGETEVENYKREAVGA